MHCNILRVRCQLGCPWSLPIFSLLPISTSSKPPNLTPISRALARALATASRLGLRPRPTRRLRRGRISAPQNCICFAPLIRVSLNDACRFWAGGSILQTSSPPQQSGCHIFKTCRRQPQKTIPHTGSPLRNAKLRSVSGSPNARSFFSCVRQDDTVPSQVLSTPISRALANAPQNYSCFASLIRV